MDDTRHLQHAEHADHTHHRECPDCFALVADLAAHERWHTRLVADLATAVERELQRK